ncbi:MAG: sialate O-acetylesterase [Pirellula sp.]|jgi:sialate O-acetylesterase
MHWMDIYKAVLVLCWTFFVLPIGDCILHAEVRLPAIFSDHMVLQRDRPLNIWGWGEPGENVRVSLGVESAEAIVSPHGTWQCTLGPQGVSHDPMDLIVSATHEIRIRDVLLGDVWLCSGQSNMEWALGACDAADDIRSSNYPLIRHFGVEYHFASTPQNDVKGRWSVCKPETSHGFSAVAYYFARRVHQETGIPIGILRSSVGGTNIECWMSQETLMNTPSLEPFAKLMRDSLAQYQEDLADVVPSVEEWTLAAKVAINEGRDIPMPPAVPDFPFGEKMFRPRCVTLHNGMIHPLKSFAMRGVLWYQGENNAGNVADGLQYVEKKRAMISDWRNWFCDPELPFYFVQLAPWQKPSSDPANADGWAYFRDAQRRCLSLPNTGMAVAIDIGDADDIHPKNKFDVGERLARWALANQYGKKIEVSGPLYRRLRVEGNKAVVEFDHVGAGLMVGQKQGREAATPSVGASLKRFAMAGSDRIWKWADARIEGETVVCTHPDIESPVAVRYAFTMNPDGANLYNRDGLPASPFRTDEW